MDSNRYRPPGYDATGTSLHFEINLKSKGSKASLDKIIPVADRNTTPHQRIVVSGSQIEDGQVTLYRQDTLLDNPTDQFSWIHLQKETRDFDEFSRFALTAAALGEEDKVLVSTLLKRVRENEKRTYNEVYTQSIVSRCDGLGSGSQAADKSATFVCFPYYNIGAMTSSSDDRAMHSTRSLLQTFYNLVPTRKRDLQQVICKTGLFPKGHIILIPQIWAIILNSRVIITSMPTLIAQGARNSLNFINLLDELHPSIIRVTDDVQKNFFFPMKYCKTWFALLRMVKDHCVSDYRTDKFDFQLLTLGDVLINAEDWQTLRMALTPIICLKIQLLGQIDPYPSRVASNYIPEKPRDVNVSVFNRPERQPIPDPRTIIITSARRKRRPKKPTSEKPFFRNEGLDEYMPGVDRGRAWPKTKNSLDAISFDDSFGNNLHRYDDSSDGYSDGDNIRVGLDEQVAVPKQRRDSEGTIEEGREPIPTEHENSTKIYTSENPLSRDEDEIQGSPRRSHATTQVAAENTPTRQKDQINIDTPEIQQKNDEGLDKRQVPRREPYYAVPNTQQFNEYPDSSVALEQDQRETPAHGVRFSRNVVPRGHYYPSNQGPDERQNHTLPEIPQSREYTNSYAALGQNQREISPYGVRFPRNAVSGGGYHPNSRGYYPDSEGYYPNNGNYYSSNRDYYPSNRDNYPSSQGPDEHRNSSRHNRISKYPRQSSSGIVVNRTGNDSMDAAHDIYFRPTKIKPVPEPFTANKVDDPSYTSLIPEIIERTRTSTKKMKPGGNEIKLSIPPVFTWGIEDDSVSTDTPIEHQCRSGGVSGNSGNIVGGNQDGGMTPAEAGDESIKQVFNRIHDVLVGAEQYRNIKYYTTAREGSYSKVEEAFERLFHTPLQSLLAPGLVGSCTATDLNTWQDALRFVVSGMSKLFGFFVPLTYSSEVSNKYWGALQDLLTIIPKIFDAARFAEPTSPITRGREVGRYIIADISGSGAADLRNIRDLDFLTLAIFDCPSCNGGQQYRTREKAFDHLLKDHFSASASNISTVSPNWVMDLEEFSNFESREFIRNALKKLAGHCAELERLAFQIQHGVSDNGYFDKNTYRIPYVLVDSFRHLIMMVITAAFDAGIADNRGRSRLAPQNHESHWLNGYFGSSAEESMEGAKSHIMAMTNIDAAHDISYEAVSPEYILALVMDDIRCRDSLGNPVNLDEVYRQFKANQHPDKRLLQELYFFMEELKIISAISKNQRLILSDYQKVLRPNSFRKTTESRISSFEFERERLQDTINAVDADLNQIKLLLNKAEYLSEQTLRGIEVRQEDHGKAIMVFTVVTVIFLPMSFVTSFFGMNTVDIRDMSRTQSFFWSISIPLTTLIIVGTLLIGYNAEIIRETIFRLIARCGYRNSDSVVSGEYLALPKENLLSVTPTRRRYLGGKRQSELGDDSYLSV
ncbi:hypothetical protein FQN57_001330 [Myotisia sp. PD_48]|nr:hypothetical protein FQN57_001330 [Myotisia sp. PD_48]